MKKIISKNILIYGAFAVTAITGLVACNGDDAPSDGYAQLVYKNGNILTVNKDGQVAQAVAVRDRMVVAAGSDRAVSRYIGKDTQVIDLAGKTMIPGIYDAHSHFSMTGMNLKFEADLNSPPIGAIKSIEEIISLLKTKQSELGTDAWLTGFGYDDTLLSEKRHPTREDLDRVSTTQPVFVTHISGHMSVANTAALKLAGITAATPNPEGGVIGKDGKGEPTGYLAETAAQLVSKFKPAFTAAQQQEGLAAAAKMYASKGVTTANDGATGPAGVEALEKAAQSGRLPVRVVAWPMGLSALTGSKAIALTSGKVKVGGIKDFHDGSIQGYTGYLSHPYHTPHDDDADYAGYPRSSREALVARAIDAQKAGVQMFIHANGDQAIADVLYAYRKAHEAHPRADARNVIIHSQMAREDQLDEMKELGVIPSFFELHTYYWGDRHRDIFLGPDRGTRISPVKSALNRGIPFTLHADTPVVPMDPMLMLWAAVNRVSTSGAVIGADQRVSVMEALRGITINAAHQNFEEKERGSIEVGKFADLVVLSADPVSVDSMKIKDIEVLETIVEGRTVYKTRN
ncbi:N-substituted formamide deformylase [Comamonas aquatilis]|uniref:amidohydrolase n=1 Tax=Comamonas aquatilis TaxID=1778406 RepID=UPI0039EE283C